MKKIRKAVIPAAGYGTRFLPVTKVVPKELIPIGNKPAIQYVVEEAVAAGVEEIILVCNREKFTLLDYFRPNAGLNQFLKKKHKKEELQELERIESLAKFSLAYQDEPLGLGHAVLCAQSAVGDEDFLVLLPDVLVVDGAPASRELAKVCGEDDWGLSLQKVSRSQVSSYGVIRGPKEKKSGVYSIQGAVEKPKPHQAPSLLSILGRYLFPSRIFSLLEDVKKGSLGEIQLTDAIDQLAQERPGRGVMVKGQVFDVGTPAGLSKAYEELGLFSSKE